VRDSHEPRLLRDKVDMERDVAKALVHAKKEGHLLFVAVDALFLVNRDILALVRLQKLGQKPQESAVLALPFAFDRDGQFNDRGGQLVGLTHRTLLLSTLQIHYTKPDKGRERN